jgi:hypothetical protein
MPLGSSPVFSGFVAADTRNGARITNAKLRIYVLIRIWCSRSGLVWLFVRRTVRVDPCLDGFGCRCPEAIVACVKITPPPRFINSPYYDAATVIKVPFSSYPFF